MSPASHPIASSSRPVVLCLSGHDPSGGAGLQADSEALLAQGCHAAPALTVLTVQNTENVSAIQPLDGHWVLAQVEKIIQDLPIAAIKLGILGSLEILETVLQIRQWLPDVPLVCDPVLQAGGGGALSKDDLTQAIRDQLLPVCTIATPNLPEARRLAALPDGDADACAERLLGRVPWLLITGGHSEDTEVENRLYSRDGLRQRFGCPRLPGVYHGSGCTLASALAGRLALGETPAGAAERALNYTWKTLRDAEILGKGQYVPRRLPLDFYN